MTGRIMGGASAKKLEYVAGWTRAEDAMEPVSHTKRLASLASFLSRLMLMVRSSYS